jgi:hypothetical protein
VGEDDRPPLGIEELPESDQQARDVLLAGVLTGEGGGSRDVEDDVGPQRALDRGEVPRLVRGLEPLEERLAVFLHRRSPSLPGQPYDTSAPPRHPGWAVRVEGYARPRTARREDG